MKQMRLKKFIIELIEQKGPMTTGEILDAFNRHSRNGTQMQSLGNLLGKDPIFVQVDYIGHSRIRNAVWNLEELKE